MKDKEQYIVLDQTVDTLNIIQTTNTSNVIVNTTSPAYEGTLSAGPTYYGNQNLDYYSSGNTFSTGNINYNYNHNSYVNQVKQTQFIFSEEHAVQLLRDAIRFLNKKSTLESLKNEIDKILDEECIKDILEE